MTQYQHLYHSINIRLKRKRGNLDTVINKIIFKLQGVSYESGLKIRGKIFLVNRGHFEIGKDVLINSSIWSNPIGGSSKTIIQIRESGVLKISNNVGISNCAITCAKSVIIEDNVMIGAGCCIYDLDFHSLKFENRMAVVDKDIKMGEVRIKEGAFIGAHSIILKNVVIGKYSVVGAGSVVTKSIPDGEIWAGNPAHFIKKLKDIQ